MVGNFSTFISPKRPVSYRTRAISFHAPPALLQLVVMLRVDLADLCDVFLRALETPHPPVKRRPPPWSIARDWIIAWASMWERHVTYHHYSI